MEARNRANAVARSDDAGLAGVAVELPAAEAVPEKRPAALAAAPVRTVRRSIATLPLHANIAAALSPINRPRAKARTGSTLRSPPPQWQRPVGWQVGDASWFPYTKL